MKYPTTLITLLVLFLPACQSTSNPEPFTIRAGEDSLKIDIAIGDDERRGEPPQRRPVDIKKEITELLNTLRTDGVGLKQETEFNIESYFTVADAFEADGLLVQAVDYLNDLKHKLVCLQRKWDKMARGLRDTRAAARLPG